MTNEERAARHERASAEFIRSSKDALTEYERMLNGEELSGHDRRAVRENVELLKRQLACFARDEMNFVNEHLIEIATWTC